MRLLFFPISDWLYGPSRGHFDGTAEALARRGHQVYVWHFQLFRRDIRKSRHPGVRIVRGMQIRLRDPSMFYVVNSLLELPTLVRLVRRLGIQVILNENILHGLLTFILCPGTLRIFDLGDYFPESAEVYYKSRLASWIVRTIVTILTRLNIRLSDVCISPHPLMLQIVRQKFAPDKPVYWVPNGVDVRLFRPEPPSQSLARKFHTTENTACFAGLIERWIDFETMVDGVEMVVRKIPDFNVVMVGPERGEPQARLRQIAAQKGIGDRFRWVGLVDRKMVPKYINLAKICLCALGRNKGQLSKHLAIPQKLAEYSACGKPTVTPPTLSLRQMNAQHVFVYRDSEELASVVEYLLLRPELEDRLRIQAVDFAKRFDYDEIARRFETAVVSEMRKSYGRKLAQTQDVTHN